MRVGRLVVLAALTALLCMAWAGLKTMPAQAASAPTNVTVGVASGCVGYIDGAPGSTYSDVAPGSNVNLTVTNDDSLVVQNISGSGVPSGTQVLNNSKTTNNETTVTLNSVTSPVTVTFTPVPTANTDPGVDVDNCPTTSSPTPSSIVINPAAATLSCTLSGSNWDLSGSFSGSSAGTEILEGSTSVAISPGSISQTVAASSTAQTLTVIDGTNYGGKGTTLASTYCPSTSTEVSSTTSTSTPNSTSTPVANATSTTSSNSHNTNSALAASDKNAESKKLHSSNTGALITSSVGLVLIIIILVILDLAGIWTFPKKFSIELWQKIGDQFQRAKKHLPTKDIKKSKAKP